MSAMPPSPEPAESAHPGPTGESSALAEEHASSRPGPSVGRAAGLASRKWVQRAEGDRRARARLGIEGEGVIVLNDRRIPGPGRPSN